MVDTERITDSRQRFELTREAVVRLDDVKLAIMYECDDWKPPSVRSRGETSDPTANRAIYAVDELGEKLEALRQEEAELTEFIGTSIAIVAAVKSGFGEIYATLLEHRYIDRWTWADVREVYGIPKSTGYYLLDVAFDWIDSVGVSRLLKGETEL